MADKGKQFRCIPIAIGLPLIFGFGSFVWLYLAYDTIDSWNSPQECLCVCIGMAAACAGMSVIAALPALRRVEIHPAFIVCRGLLPRHTFSMDYRSCQIGFDYHEQNGNKVWWIYLCQGKFPEYKAKNNPAERINGIKIRPGFIRIMYSDEVYEALLEVLSKDQKTALISGRRWAGFEKNGTIIF